VTNLVGSGDLVDTAWLNLEHIKPAQLRFGRFKQPFSLEELTSSNNIDFMERSYVNQLAPAKRLGVMLHGEPISGLTYAVSRFQQGSSQTSEGEGMQSAARVTANASQLFDWKNTVMHIGAAGTQGHYQIRPATSSQTSAAASTTTRATIIGFNSENRGLANVYRAQIGGSTLITPGFGESDEIAANVDKEMTGLELALAWGPIKLQGEMASASFDAVHVSAGQRVIGDVDTEYVEVMWNVTGERWADMYRGGAFSGLKPNRNFGGGGWGAWQVGVRLSGYDASDVTTAGTGSREQNSDEAETLTVGVNWWMNPNTKFMFNYAKTDFEIPVVPLDVAGTSARDS
jgi:phosphate-selective porin OprO/OprP